MARKRVEYKKRIGTRTKIRGSRTGGLNASVKLGKSTTLNTKHGLRLARSYKGFQLALQGGSARVRGRWGTKGGTNLNLSKSGVSVSKKNSLGAFNLTNPNRSSVNFLGVQVRGKKAAPVAAWIFIFQCFGFLFKFIFGLISIIIRFFAYTIRLLLSFIWMIISLMFFVIVSAYNALFGPILRNRGRPANANEQSSAAVPFVEDTQGDRRSNIREDQDKVVGSEPQMETRPPQAATSRPERREPAPVRGIMGNFTRR